MQFVEFLRHASTWQSQMQRTRLLYDDRLAPAFNVFDFISPDEMRLSEILAWLLNGRGTHGQGDRFLRLFLKHLCRLPSGQASVNTERVITGGRFDIEVETQGHILVIENKPWAADQKDQLKRYLAYLLSKGKKFDIVYLTPLGTSPSDNSIPSGTAAAEIEAGRLHLCSYAGDILPWLKQCRGEASADRVAAFLHEFDGFVRSKLLGVRDMTEQEELVDLIIRSPDDMTLAGMKVIIAGQNVREGLIKSFVNKVQDAAVQSRWLVSSNIHEYWSRGRELVIDFGSTFSYGFTIGFETSNHNNCYYGVKKIADRSPVSDVADRLAKELGIGQKGDETFPWWQYFAPTDAFFPFDPNWQSAPEPWVALKNGLMSKATFQLAERVNEILASMSTNP